MLCPVRRGLFPTLNLPHTLVPASSLFSTSFLMAASTSTPHFCQVWGLCQVWGRPSLKLGASPTSMVGLRRIRQPSLPRVSQGGGSVLEDSPQSEVCRCELGEGGRHRRLLAQTRKSSTWQAGVQGWFGRSSKTKDLLEVSIEVHTWMGKPKQYVPEVLPKPSSVHAFKRLGASHVCPEAWAEVVQGLAWSKRVLLDQEAPVSISWGSFVWVLFFNKSSTICGLC